MTLNRRYLVIVVSIFVFASGACSKEIARFQSSSALHLPERYKTHSRFFDDGLELRSVYPCLDEECQDVDVRAIVQIVSWAEGEITLDSRYLVIGHLFFVEGKIVALIWNNHSSFLVRICSDGTLDYLAETHELYDQRVLGGELSVEAPFYLVEIVVADESAYPEPGEKTLEYRILMGGGLQECQPATMP